MQHQKGFLRPTVAPRLPPVAFPNTPAASRILVISILVFLNEWNESIYLKILCIISNYIL